TDWATHDETQGFTVHPPELEREIRRQFGGRQMGPEIPVQKSLKQLKRLRSEAVQSAVNKGAFVKWLLGRQEWDFFITVFGETHPGGHLFWPMPGNHTNGSRVREEALLDCYLAVDRALGEVVQSCLDANTVLVVFSVHGMGPDTSQDHFTRAIMDRVNERFGVRHFDARTASNLLTAIPRPRRVMRVLRQRLPPGLQHAIGPPVPLRWRDAVVNRAVTAGYDWGRTPGLAILGGVTGFIRFNLRGREEAGMLEPGSDAHRSYTRWVQNAIESWRHADTGEAL